MGKTLSHGEKRLYEEYDLLCDSLLKPEFVYPAIHNLSNNKLRVILFQKLEDFDHHWCQGEFIYPLPYRNLLQRKSMQLQTQKFLGLSSSY